MQNDKGEVIVGNVATTALKKAQKAFAGKRGFRYANT